MLDYLKNACEEIDASMFSGDAFQYEENLKPLKDYIERWNRAIVRIEKSLAEEEIKNCVCPASKLEENKNSSSDNDQFICAVCGKTYQF